MPLLNQKNISTDYYSKETVELAKKDEVDLKKIEDDDFEPITLEWVLEIERTAYARSLEPCSAAEIAEMMAALDPSDPPADVAAPEPVAPTPDVAPAAEWSKNVLPERSKNVSARERRSPANDATIIAKMRTFRVGDDSAACTSLVSNPLPCITPSLTTPISTPSDSTKASAPTPANDNLIPVWSLTGDAVTALSATVALQLSETAAVAFTFNLTPDAIAKAKDSPTDFLDPLKRSFDVELKRVLKGIALPYWFAIDVEDGRLHIHGAFLSPATNLSMVRKIRQAMKAAWGEWQGPGKRKQLRFKTLYSDDWATYCMRNQREVAKVIGPRTFTINQALRRDAEWAYAEIRRIMRAA